MKFDEEKYLELLKELETHFSVGTLIRIKEVTKSTSGREESKVNYFNRLSDLALVSRVRLKYDIKTQTISFTKHVLK